MSFARALVSKQDFEARASRFEETAIALHNAGDEWSVVCYFYSAYHFMRWSILKDPIFDSVNDLSRKTTLITVNDRTVDRHQGRVSDGTRNVGINDIAAELYTAEISGAYRALHSLSVDVRYKSGVAAIRFARAKGHYLAVKDAYHSGVIAAQIP